MKTLLSIVALSLVLSLAGCQRSVVPIAQAQAGPSASPIVETVKARHLCGAKTKAGVACRKPVKNEGDRCWMHQGQPAFCTTDADCEAKSGKK